MLDLLLARAEQQWTDWFHHRPDGRLEPLLLAGGPAHRGRVSVLLFAGGRSPQAIMKIGFTRREGEFLEAEFEAMSKLRPLLPPRLASSMPRALDLYQKGQVTAVAAEVLEGERLLVPSLTGEVSTKARRIMDSYLRRSFAFARDLAEATAQPPSRNAETLAGVVERFVAMFLEGEPATARRVDSFGTAVAESGIEWLPAWQHQDVAVGNVLEHRGQLRFVDWEHASPGCQPWFDVAYAPIVTSHLAQRVDALPSVREAALAALGATTPIGSLLRMRMEEVWDYPLPLGWGVALTAMIAAMRRVDEGRAGSAEWADLVKMMVCDEDFRSELDWLVPRW